jgi:peptidoglycan biosynthesis protein MviN/MurJ (putative lipid II flippase)
MDIVALIAVLIGIAFLSTRLFCRRPVGQSRPPWFLLAITAAFCTSLAMVFIFYGRELFTRRFWVDGKAPMIILVPIVFGICLVVSLIPALLVVRHYRKRLEDENHVS